MAFVQLFKPAIAILSALTFNVLTFPTFAQPTAAKSYIVVLKKDINPSAVALEHANIHALNVAFTYNNAIKGYAARIPEARLAILKKDPRVLFISEDRPVSITAQTIPTGIKRIQANNSTTKSGNGSGSVNTPVAIIDTGIQSNHPDLNVVGGKDCVSNLNNYNDGNGHGTHVAGTVAAKDNTAGVVGVVPGTPLYAIKVLGSDGSGTTSSVICGIDWVTANAATKGIKVANMSLGSPGADDGNCGLLNLDAMHNAICGSVQKGVTYVVAAGNSGENFANSVPASYNEVLTVTAISDFNGVAGGGARATCRSDVDDTAADFSNFTTINSSEVGHTIAAPGTCINSTWINSTYKTISGTSMASPHVAGAVALCIASAKCANLTPSQIITKMRNDAAAQPASYGFKNDPNSPNGDRYYGNLLYTGGY
ncbi:MAG TPA: S8 family peptidase [Oculatellaceae cyanobacterium]|jgi:subtilisin family serine protease